MTKRTVALQQKKRLYEEENQQKDDDIPNDEDDERGQRLKKKPKKEPKKVKPSKVQSTATSGGVGGETISLLSQNYPTTKATLPLSINYHNFTPEPIPSNWGTPSHATSAAQNLDCHARLMGMISLEFSDVDETVMTALTKSVPKVIQYRSNFHCNEDGEYPTPTGQIPLSRVYDFLQSKELQPSSHLTKELLHGLWALQSPRTSPWNIPFIRVYSFYSRETLSSSRSLLTISYQLYYSRLIFELISDPTIQFITKHLKNSPCQIIRCQNPYLLKQAGRACDLNGNKAPGGSSTHKTAGRGSTRALSRTVAGSVEAAHVPAMYSKPDVEMLQIPEYRFSLQGLLKHVENSGYEVTDFQQPKNLLVQLYDYQLSTCQWMLDHELDEKGLNSQFWEEWQFTTSNDRGGANQTSGYLYYFPLGGEYRFTKPPVARGGLLCEEMGLGKTVEILALILTNPSPLRPQTFPQLLTSPPASNYNTLQSVPCHTSLIVVPNHLLPQWWNEITKRVKCGTDLGDGEITAINLFQRGRKDAEMVPICDIRGLEIIRDPVTGLDTYERSEWGVFDHLRGSVVEIRNVPFVTSSSEIILRGLIAGFSTYYRKRADDTSTTPMIYPCIEIYFEMTNENFHSPHSDLHKFDIVLTSYSEIRESRGSQNIYQTHQWHRIILDECQEIKNTTNQVATLCANLESERRWMVSGTPLCTKIEDLHGELNFLKIWPFCLNNSKDGFWDLRIGKPFLKKDESALKLLYALLDVVMMRHTKNQRNLLTNEPLIQMPSRTIEWRGVELNGDDRFIYEYLESFAADAYEQYLERHSGNEESQLWSKSQSGQLKSLYSLLSRCCTHTSAISLQNLDHLRRILVRNSYLSAHVPTTNAETNEVTIPLLTPEEVLNRVQSLGSGVAGGLNRESNRVQASVTAHEADEKLRLALQERSLQSLNEEVVGLGLPQPISWNTLPYTVSVDHRSTSLVIYPLIKEKKSKKTSSSSKPPPSSSTSKSSNQGDEEEDEDCVKKQSLALHSHLLRGDVGRVKWADRDEAEFVVAKVVDRKSNPHENMTPSPTASTSEVESTSKRSKKSSPVPEETMRKENPQNEVLGEIEMESCWTLEPQLRSTIFKKDIAKRKQPFIDLLVTHAHTLKSCSGGDSKSATGVVQIHEGGFSTIYKLMAGQSVSCPLCLVEACRPTITTCVHVYCHDCIMDVVKRESSPGGGGFPSFGGAREAKCPVCRRGITYSSLMEVKMDNVEELQEDKDLPLKKCLSNELTPIPEEEVEEAAKLDNREVVPPLDATAAGGNPSTGRSKRSSSRKKIKSNADVDVDATEVINNSSSNSSSLPSSTNSKIDDITFIIPTFQHESGVAPLSTEVEEKFHKESRGGSMYRDPSLPSLAPTALPIFRRAVTHLTPKIKALLDDMEMVKKDDLFAKFVIFSQYKETILVMQSILAAKNIQSAALVTSTSLDNQSSLRTFYQDPNCNVLLLTTGVAATGLTLTIAHILYMLEPCANAAEEAQAVSRVHRIGQTKCVRCVIFYAKNSCEDRLLHLRERNKLLSEILANERSDSLLTALEVAGGEEEESSSGSTKRSLKSFKSKQRQQLQEQKEQQSGGVFFVGKNLGFLYGSDEDRSDRRKIAELEDQMNPRHLRSSSHAMSSGYGFGSSWGTHGSFGSSSAAAAVSSSSNSFSLFPRTGVVASAITAAVSSLFTPSSSSPAFENPSCSNGSRPEAAIVIESDESDASS